MAFKIGSYISLIAVLNRVSEAIKPNIVYSTENEKNVPILIFFKIIGFYIFVMQILNLRKRLRGFSISLILKGEY